MPNDSARAWLRDNAARSPLLSKIADDIEAILARHRARGLKTRRDWWEALGGTAKGRPMVVDGVTFPILAGVRRRRGLEPVEGAIELPADVLVPDQTKQARWAPKKVRAKKGAKKTK